MKDMNLFSSAEEKLDEAAKLKVNKICFRNSEMYQSLLLWNSQIAIKTVGENFLERGGLILAEIETFTLCPCRK